MLLQSVHLLEHISAYWALQGRFLLLFDDGSAEVLLMLLQQRGGYFFLAVLAYDLRHVSEMQLDQRYCTHRCWHVGTLMSFLSFLIHLRSTSAALNDDEMAVADVLLDS